MNIIKNGTTIEINGEEYCLGILFQKFVTIYKRKYINMLKEKTNFNIKENIESLSIKKMDTIIKNYCSSIFDANYEGPQLCLKFVNEDLIEMAIENITMKKNKENLMFINNVKNELKHKHSSYA